MKVVDVVGEDAPTVNTAGSLVFDGLLLAAAEALCSIRVEALLAVDLSVGRSRGVGVEFA